MTADIIGISFDASLHRIGHVEYAGSRSGQYAPRAGLRVPPSVVEDTGVGPGHNQSQESSFCLARKLYIYIYIYYNT